MSKAEIKRLAARYPKLVEWSDEDECFIGRCPMLFSGGVHGRDEAEVYRELCRAAEEWVEILQKDGVPLPEAKRSADYSGKFMVRVAPEIHQRLALKAMAAGESLNSMVAKALAKA
ncbi:MAG: toxin-antitoxin system HicB family antitoxin [Planctomycetes bacterium]|nr:toxin-antitoxin system HicB family antitoxin [Planctomycetota bacterium]